MTDRQAEFVRQYLIDLNATQAAIRAGYSPSTANREGSRLLSNAVIAAAIKEAQDRRAERTKVTQDRVLTELARIGFSDYRVLFDGRGQLKAHNEMDDDGAAVVASVEVFEEFERRGNERVQTGYTKKVKLWDKVAALSKMGQHLGMFTEKVEISGPGGAPMVCEVTIEHHDAQEVAPEGEPAAGGSDGRQADASVPPGPDAGVAVPGPVHPRPGGHPVG